VQAGIGMPDSKVLGYLGRALSLELSAVQLYTTQARLTANWGFDQAAEKLRHEAHEEMQHVERIVARMLFKGMAPNESRLRPVRLGPDLPSLLKINQSFEQELVDLYHEAATYCKGQGFYNDGMFFQQLLKEEQQHADELGAWLASLESISIGHVSNRAQYARSRSVL
jgi:bacterioferritin